jgi:hypothetical protein
LVSEPGKLLKRYAYLFDIQAMQAAVQVAFNVAEEYLIAGESILKSVLYLWLKCLLIYFFKVGQRN